MRITSLVATALLLVACGGSDPTTSSNIDDSNTSTAPAGKMPAIDPAATPTTMEPKQDPKPGQVEPPGPAEKPTFAWAPDYADFPETTLGDSTTSQTMVLTNTSDIDASQISLLLNGSQFVLGANECSGALKAHASCKVAITFHPTLAIPAEGLLYLQLANVSQDHVVAHLTGTGRESPKDPGMSTPVYPPGFYPMCSNPMPAGSDWLCGSGAARMKKDGYVCGRCLVGSSQECLPDTSGTICVQSCGECK